MFSIPEKTPIVLYISKNPKIKGIKYYISMSTLMGDFFSGSAEYSIALHVFGTVGCEIFCIAGSKDILKSLESLSNIFDEGEIFSLYIYESLWTKEIQEYTQNYAQDNENRFKLTKVILDIDRTKK